MTNTLTSYMLLSRNLATSLQRKGKDPIVARETAYYQANIGKVKSVDDFMADKRLYNYAMKAFGLEDMGYAKAFMRKVLTEGTSSATAFANRLADDRYVAFAKAYDFTPGASAKGTDPVVVSPEQLTPAGSAKLSLPYALARPTTSPAPTRRASPSPPRSTRRRRRASPSSSTRRPSPARSRTSPRSPRPRSARRSTPRSAPPAPTG